MKLLTLRVHREFHPAVIAGEEVLDLVLAGDIIPLARFVPAQMRRLLSGGGEGLDVIRRVLALAAEDTVRDALRSAGALLAFAEARLAPVVPDPNLILSGSMNSRGHLSEMNDPIPELPAAFEKTRSALAASGDDIQRPPGHDHMIDWEGEFCLVLGARCHRVPEAEAMHHVAGYTLMNDISAREYVLPFVKSVGAAPIAQAWERNVLGKNFPTFCPLGPVIATPDEFPAGFGYHMQTLVNGEVMQSSTQEDLVFGPAQMLSYYSNFHIFEPGDIISMGSPSGVGMSRRPQIFLQPGDIVEVRVPEIGTLINRIAQ
jgi:2-keto-4-pentenoate hydratase/2-oxohepta-3-ene-1,7-dioic acid hydratase in catechol pathway